MGPTENTDGNRNDDFDNNKEVSSESAEENKDESTMTKKNSKKDKRKSKKQGSHNQKSERSKERSMIKYLPESLSQAGKYFQEENKILEKSFTVKMTEDIMKHLIDDIHNKSKNSLSKHLDEMQNEI